MNTPRQPRHYAVMQPLTYEPVTSTTKNEEYRHSRREMQTEYNEKKVVFLEKERERARKKLKEKLERYKGVGLLGNRLGSLEQEEEEKNEELKRRLDALSKEIEDIKKKLSQDDTKCCDHKRREKALKKLEENYKDACLLEEMWKNGEEGQKEAAMAAQKERERALKKLERYKGIGLLGQRLGSGEESQEPTMTELSPVSSNPDKEKVLVLRSDCCFVSERETLVPTYNDPTTLRHRFHPQQLPGDKAVDNDTSLKANQLMDDNQVDNNSKAHKPPADHPKVNEPVIDDTKMDKPIADNEPEAANPKIDKSEDDVAKVDNPKSSFDMELSEIRRRQQEMYLARLNASKKDD